MGKPFSNGALPDGFLELADMCGISAVEDTAHRVVMLQFFDRGVALLLTYGEVLTLAEVVVATLGALRKGVVQDVREHNAGSGRAPRQARKKKGV